MDLSRIRRETIRWQIILTLNMARPMGAFEKMVLSVIQAEYPDATQLEVRKELDYLDGRDLIELKKQPDGRWLSNLTRYGVDVAEYTVDVDPGIARPAKYFDA